MNEFDSAATQRMRDTRRDLWVQRTLATEHEPEGGGAGGHARGAANVSSSGFTLHDVLVRPRFTLADLDAECVNRSRFWTRTRPLFPGFVTVRKACTAMLSLYAAAHTMYRRHQHYTVTKRDD